MMTMMMTTTMTEMTMMTITEQDYDDAIEELWDLIFKMRDADERELGEAQEWISMQIIEVSNLAWMIGKQSVSVANDKIDSTTKESN